MGTRWSEIVTGDAMVFIDDVRMEEELAVNGALFFRKFSLYVRQAIELLNRPPELGVFLETGLQPPTWADGTWTSTPESVGQETVVETGLVGYELFSCVKRERDKRGVVRVSPYPGAAYDKDTGQVTFPAQAAAGTTYDFDLYNDGQFAGELTGRQRSLLGRAVALVWDERLDRTWLNLQPKIHDSSFNVGNEGSTTRASTARLSANRSAFFGALHKYEQDCAFASTVPQGRRRTALV